MDRQNVEYIEREDDEEFDEFGRKKKRRKVDNKTDEVLFSYWSFCVHRSKNFLHLSHCKVVACSIFCCNQCRVSLSKPFTGVTDSWDSLVVDEFVLNVLQTQTTFSLVLNLWKVGPSTTLQTAFQAP